VRVLLHWWQALLGTGQPRRPSLLALQLILPHFICITHFFMLLLPPPWCHSKGDDRRVCVYKRQQRQRGDPRFELPLGPASLQAMEAYFAVRQGGWC